MAFANEQDERLRYLRTLPDEVRALRVALQQAEDAGLCELVVRSNATLDEILDILRRYRDRIAVFHYGGHADSYYLLVEKMGGLTASVHAGGFAALLGEQRGLQLVFLNGCSTQHHVNDLLAAGVPAVLATAQDIEDSMATEFATQFYTGFASGAGINTAYNEAAAALHTRYGNPGFLPDWLPWNLCVRPGSEETKAWNLPNAVGNPLYGLPALPEMDLPDMPYRHLNWFRRTDAETFFGRGHEIRDLYQRVTAPHGAPIVLFYGQSGVGKSSLLAAGLLPRLEQVCTVVYARRDQECGLAGSLRDAIGGQENLLTEPCATPADDSSRPGQMCATKAGRPLVVILDQVEEIFTRPNLALPNELGEFLAKLQVLFGVPAKRPQLRLILSFRKEWLAEIEKRLAEHHLSCTKVFLQRLVRQGIVEAINGPARCQRLRYQYNLTLADGLAEEIADDLLADHGSAVAPTLQILLSKLWERAKERNYDRPIFDRDLYHALRGEGLLLSDFLDRQLGSLRRDRPELVDSGLALDLLAFHTTPVGTAEQRTLEELKSTYRHQQTVLPELLDKYRDLYLLVDPVENRPDSEPASRMAHDTLAPLVRQRFDESDAPGQRARRILESRVSRENTNLQVGPLGDSDLAIVEAGQLGMRAWYDRETALVVLSRKALAQRNWRTRLVLVAFGIMIAVIGGIVTWGLPVALQQWDQWTADRARRQATSLVQKGEQMAAHNDHGGAAQKFQQALNLKWSPPPDTPIYVWIEPGEFTMGSDDANPPRSNEGLQQETTDGFWIMRTEVTNAQYARCVEAGKCDELSNELWKEEARANYPVTYVDESRAQQYAEWVGGRLPLEKEWEKACRGTDGRSYPWGDTAPTADMARYSSSTRAESRPEKVGSYPSGANGLYDMAGNVWELAISKNGELVARGGSFAVTDERVRCVSVNTKIDMGGADYVGFRVISLASVDR